jgi:hypothetical protein
MTEELTPRELATARKQARAARIRNIRRRVAITAATLAAVFSGVVLARTQLNPTTNPEPDQIAMARAASGDGDSPESGAAVTIVTATLRAADDMESDEHEGESDSEYGEHEYEDDEDEDEDGEHEDDEDESGPEDGHPGLVQTVVKAANGAVKAVLGSGVPADRGSTATAPSTPAPLVTSQS